MRLSASPCSHDYGALTVRVQLHHRVKYLRRIPATVFFPRPDVDSAVVRLLPRDRLEMPAHDHELLLKLIRVGFSQRRKQLKKLLRQYDLDWDTIARDLHIHPNARAEELSLLQWIGLANWIAPPPRTRHLSRRAASCSRWSMRVIEFGATPAALKCMGITCAIGPFTSSFSARPVTFTCSNALVGKIAIR